MTKKMTKRQSWALFCITKEDYRKTHPDMTYDEASALIEKLNLDKNYIKTKKETHNPVTDILIEANIAGHEAVKNLNIIPMIVQKHANPIDDNSPVTQEWLVEGGVCGFASIHFKANTSENKKFLANLKKAGLAGENEEWQKDTYRGGYYKWISEFGQSMQRKEAYAYAFKNVLEKYSITAYVHSKMD